RQVPERDEGRSETGSRITRGRPQWAKVMAASSGRKACLTFASVSRRPHCQMFQRGLPKHHGTRGRECSTICRGHSWASAMRAAGGGGRGASRLTAGKRRLLQGAAVGTLTLPGALMLLDVAWAQVGETLPEVTVTAPLPAPVRRAAPAVAP